MLLPMEAGLPSALKKSKYKKAGWLGDHTPLSPNLPESFSSL